MPDEFMSKSPYFAEELIIRPGRRLWRVVRYRWHASGFEAVEAMADTSKPVDMSVDGNVVGRIGEDEIGFFNIQQHAERLGGTSVTANEPVASNQPHVTRPGH
jgi:hypothetical protein